MNLDEARYEKDPGRQIKKWSDFLRTIRENLHQKGYLEVTTSSLVTTGAFESTIDPIRVQGSRTSWELHTSPEMEMKRLLSTSHNNIYQITKCFRDDPETEIHGKEFTMLEFYKLGASYNDIIGETKALFTLVHGATIPFKEVTIQTLFHEILDLDLNQLATQESLAKVLRQKNTIQIDTTDSWEDLFFKLMIEKIEPSFDKETAYIVKDYPSSTSVLSKQIKNTVYAERFEIYWQNKELCNGCTETSDITILKNNFDTENKKRRIANKSPHPTPDQFFASMKSFPKCSGVAIGLDRLFNSIQ